MKTIFQREFDRINEAFGQTFAELFGGGKARLELEDPNDVLNCGIDIKVQPPGKALKTITLLSGGEKAFVAIALYFAILKVRPTPFVVMDEIEAALDDNNVARFAQYMRTMADKTQFIVITHRRGTMEEADALYGVTMQEQGVSRMLSLNLNEMERELNLRERPQAEEIRLNENEKKNGWLPILGYVALIVVLFIGIKVVFAGLGRVIPKTEDVQPQFTALDNREGQQVSYSLRLLTDEETQSDEVAAVAGTGPGAGRAGRRGILAGAAGGGRLSPLSAGPGPEPVRGQLYRHRGAGPGRHDRPGPPRPHPGDGGERGAGQSAVLPAHPVQPVEGRAPAQSSWTAGSRRSASWPSRTDSCIPRKRYTWDGINNDSISTLVGAACGRPQAEEGDGWPTLPWLPLGGADTA